MGTVIARVGSQLPAWVAAVTLGGCTIEIVDRLGAADQADAETGATAADDGWADGSGSSAGDDGTGDGDEHSSDGASPLFDVGDGGEAPMSSCAAAAAQPSQLGCEFFGIDVDGPGLFDYEPFGYVVINPLDEPAHVVLERYTGRSWQIVDAADVAGADEHVFTPADFHAIGTGVHSGATVRISSSHPVAVVQAHAAAGAAISASATMLLPTAGWSTQTPVAGWRTHIGVGEWAHLAVVARAPGTSVVIDPTCEIAAAPADWAGAWEDVDEDGELELVHALEPGELLRIDAEAIDAAEVDHGTTGSDIRSGQEHLTSVFTAHSCASIPDYQSSCGHMQEQMVAALVGTRFVAPRMVAAGDAQLGLTHERGMVQVVATEPDTAVSFAYADGGIGVELDAVILDRGEAYAVYQFEHELAIHADKPIVATSYMTNALLTELGSPSMVQLAPLSQWARDHWIWAPAGFETQLLVASSAAVEVEVDGISGLAGEATPPFAASLVETNPVAAADQLAPAWVVRRFAVGPDIHWVRASGPASVVVAGWQVGDGFAYLGGWGPALPPLGPEG